MSTTLLSYKPGVDNELFALDQNEAEDGLYFRMQTSVLKGRRIGFKTLKLNEFSLIRFKLMYL